MLIKDGSGRGGPAPRSGSGVWVLAVASFLAVGAGLGFGLGFGFRDLIRPTIQTATGRTEVGAVVGSVVRAPVRLVESWLRPPDVERLHIDVKFKHMNKLHERRDEALRQGLLVTREGDFVPGQIRIGDQTTKVKLRLKGDLPDHLRGEKWSLRIHVRRGDALFGMRRFSLQTPASRAFQAEPLFMETLRDAGVLALRYRFVDVSLNGTDLGVMALEEHFSKELLESQARREGPILKFDESLFWDQLLKAGGHGPFDSYRNAPIAAFGEAKLRERGMSADLDAAFALLRGFVDGKLSPSQAFDAEHLGRYLAVCELWRATHAVRWHNLRFYFDPVDRKLSPIGFDASLQVHYLGHGLLSADEPIAAAFLADEAVRVAFVREIARLAGGFEDGRLPKRLRALEQEHLRILHREFPLRAPIDLTALRRRLDELRAITVANLTTFDPSIHATSGPPAAAVRALLVRDGTGITLELASTLPSPVVVNSIWLRRSAGSGEEEPPSEPLPFAPITLAATRHGALPSVRRFALPGTRSASGLEVEGLATVVGGGRSMPFRARPFVLAAESPTLPDPSSADVIGRHAFLYETDDPLVLGIRPGSWRIDESLVLPQGIGLRIEGPTRLRFAADAALVVRGPMDLAGEADQPIVLEPAGDGQEASWPGLVVLGARRASRWAHVRVERTRGFRYGTWSLTGGVTFYESAIDIESSTFEGHRGEDALNVIRSDFSLTDVNIHDAASDALDVDFGRGTITGSSFDRIGGDAIDISGSVVEVRSTRIRRTHDKALSIGEGSQLVAEEVEIDDVGTGVASKDRSVGRIAHSTLGYIRHAALMAYTKKPEYGPSELEAEDLTLEAINELAVAQTGSRIVIDGKIVANRDVDVDALYGSGAMKK